MGRPELSIRFCGGCPTHPADLLRSDDRGVRTNPNVSPARRSVASGLARGGISRRRRTACLSCDAAFREELQPPRYRTRSFSVGTSVTLLQARHPRRCNIPDLSASDWRNKITIVHQCGSAACCNTMMTKIEKEEGNSHESLEDFHRSVAGTNAVTVNECIGSYQHFEK